MNQERQNALHAPGLKHPNSLLDSFKRTISGKSVADILNSDPRIRAIDNMLHVLQRSFPKLQAVVDENEKVWSSLGHNVMSMADVLKAVGQSDVSNTRVHTTLDTLRSAGKQVFKAVSSYPFKDEGQRCQDELRSFNEELRSLQAMRTDCITLLKAREYCKEKVKAMHCSEREFRKISVRNIAHRVRNERNLDDVVRETESMIERLQKRAVKTLLRKERIVRLVLKTFIRLQNENFGPGISEPVMDAFRQTGVDPVHRRGHEVGRMARTGTVLNVSCTEDNLMDDPGDSQPIPFPLQLSIQKTVNNTGIHDLDRIESQYKVDQIKIGIDHPTSIAQGHSSTRYNHDSKYSQRTGVRSSNCTGNSSKGKHCNCNKLLSMSADSCAEKHNHCAEKRRSVRNRDDKNHSADKEHNVSAECSRNVERSDGGSRNAERSDGSSCDVERSGRRSRNNERCENCSGMSVDDEGLISASHCICGCDEEQQTHVTHVTNTTVHLSFNGEL